MEMDDTTKSPQFTSIAPTPFEGPTGYALTILYAMNRMGKHIYSGTVPAHVIKKRRAAGRVAKAQRKTNR